MAGLEDRVVKQKLPDWMYRATVPKNYDLNYEHAVKILETEDNIKWFERVSGIRIPDEYKKDISPQYQMGR